MRPFCLSFTAAGIATLVACSSVWSQSAVSTPVELQLASNTPVHATASVELSPEGSDAVDCDVLSASVHATLDGVALQAAANLYDEPGPARVHYLDLDGELLDGQFEMSDPDSPLSGQWWTPTEAGGCAIAMRVEVSTDGQVTGEFALHVTATDASPSVADDPKGATTLTVDVALD